MFHFFGGWTPLHVNLLQSRWRITAVSFISWAAAFFFYWLPVDYSMNAGPYGSDQGIYTYGCAWQLCDWKWVMDVLTRSTVQMDI